MQQFDLLIVAVIRYGAGEEGNHHSITIFIRRAQLDPLAIAL
jgi:hypothetical protein